jgi:hypothetical protein
MAGIEEGWLKIEDRTAYELDRAADAHRDVEGRRTNGKLYLIPTSCRHFLPTLRELHSHADVGHAAVALRRAAVLLSWSASECPIFFMSNLSFLFKTKQQAATFTSVC